MSNVAIFGGSFNPPHLGHVYGIATALSCADVDMVWLMPCHQHAFAKDLASFHHRLAMCNAAIAPFDPKRVAVTDIESTLEGENHTIDTLHALEQSHPEHRFSLVIGTDILTERASWKDFDTLEERYPFVLLGRQDHPTPAHVSVSPPLPNVSSTEILHRIHGNEAIGDLVPAAVAQYIQDQGLYR